jgi:hypothetical protein
VILDNSICNKNVVILLGKCCKHCKQSNIYFVPFLKEMITAARKTNTLRFFFGFLIF